MSRPSSSIPSVSGDRRASSASIDHREQMILKEKARSLQENKVTLSSSFGAMLENIRHRASELSLWNDDMQKDLPKRWEKHGNMIVFPQDSFQHNNWRLIGRELWEIVATSLSIERLGRKRLIANDLDRTPHVDILYGGHGWVEHQDENGFSYIYDASKKVFEIWRGKEIARIAQIDAHGEVIVNLMSGLGYYAFPWVARAAARHVHAVDWDEEAIESLGGWLHIQEAIDPKRKRVSEPQKDKSKSPSAQKSTENGASAKEKTDVNGNTKIGEKKLQRKLSRSASIVEEMENRALPPATLDKEFEEGKWRKIEEHVQGFAWDLAEQCCRYMNNVNVVDGIYWVQIKNISVLRPRSSTRQTDIVCVDLFTGFSETKQEKRRRATRASPSETLNEHIDESLGNLSEEDHRGQGNDERDQESQKPRRRRNWEEEILKQIEEEDRLEREEKEKQKEKEKKK
ncbi:unnamed protein product, partial [Mesorhabditis belari]|uniref:Uncharacterized protein n=1 Tax=Mesorhabditis belari TaxID=2138241 RepID=A0AAF3F1C0_9BILA